MRHSENVEDSQVVEENKAEATSRSIIEDKSSSINFRISENDNAKEKDESKDEIQNQESLRQRYFNISYL